MEWYSYILLAIVYYFLSKIDKKFKIEGASLAPLLIVFGLVLSFIFAWMAVKIIIALFILITLIIKKIKIVFSLKLLALLGFGSLTALGGPLAWILTGFIILAIIGYIWDSYVTTKAILVKGLSGILLSIRKSADWLRMKLPGILKHSVLILEVPLICSTSAYGLWKLLEWFNGVSVSDTDFILRLLIIAAYSVFIYRIYLRDTTPPNIGSDGPDFPGPDLAGKIISEFNPEL